MAFMMIGERINGMFKDIGEAVAKFDPKPIQDWAVKQTQAGAALSRPQRRPDSG